MVEPRAKSHVVTVGSPSGARRATGALPRRVPILTVRAKSLAGLRALSVVRRQTQVRRRLVIEVEGYRAPFPGWRGRLGAIPEADSATITWPKTEPGLLRVSLRFSEPVSLADAIRAVVPALGPEARLHAFGSPRVAVAAGVPAGVLALLPESTARRPRPEPRPEVLRGTDILIVKADEGSGADREDEALDGNASGATSDAPTTMPVLRRRIDDPSSDAAIEPRYTIEVDALGQICSDPVPHTIDLRVHNPIGWVQDLHSDGIVGEVHVEGDEIRLVRDNTFVVSRAPLDRPISPTWVRLLRKYQIVTLAALTEPRTSDRRRALASRLSELAACGPVMFGAERLPRVLALLDLELARWLREPGAPPRGLERTVHAVSQHRAAMRGHAGVFALDRAVRGLGFGSIVPHVTALLVTNRPDRIVTALRQLQRQTYERFDVVVVSHGVSLPEIPADVAPIVRAAVELPESVLFGDALATASALAGGDLLTKVDDDDYYGPDHVWDLVLAWMFSGATVVGKQPEYAHLEALDLTVQRSFRSETYTTAVAGGTMLISAADLARVGGWRGVPRSVDRALLQRVLEDGGLVYATNAHGFVYVRHQEGHTWNAETRAFLSRNLDQWTGLPADLLQPTRGLFRGDGYPRKRRWALLNPATPGAYGDRWGDTPFCESLARELRRRGEDVTVYRRGEFDEQSPRPDVVLWVRGLTRAERAPGALNVLWVISHPDEVSTDEIRDMDLVFAASPSWAARMSQESGRSVEPLLQAVDATRFAPADDDQPRMGGAVFVGAARPERPRRVVLDAVAAGLDVKVWGPGWAGLVPDVLVAGEYLDPADLPATYATADVILADHHDDMAREGFVANRVFEAAATGACVVSDRVDGLAEIFGDQVRVGASPEDFAALTDARTRDELFGDALARTEAADRVRAEHSFAARSATLVAAVTMAERLHREGRRLANNSDMGRA